MKRLLLASVIMLCVATSGSTAELLAGITGLAVLQKSRFQGVAPGIATTLQTNHLVVEGDYEDVHLDIYYLGIGWLSDTTLQYGYRLTAGPLSVIPAVGVGANLGFLHGPVVNLYLPVSLILRVVDTPRLQVQGWAQLRPYFDAVHAWSFWIGGKVALDLILSLGGWRLYLEPIAGGGGTEALIGLRAGIALEL